jgi:phthalate 4,5-dioxygenase oxygenase subunit
VLSAADNELLTRVSPGTPMGDYMRQFWVPLMRACLVQPGGDPVRGRALSTSVVVFRSRHGELGCLDEACPHRRASLALAHNNGDALTCIYHGWAFDPTGTCVDVPTEPVEHRAAFGARVKAKTYPVAEAGGMIWVYLGDATQVPPVPDFEFNLLPADHVRPMVAITACNWLQCLEGLIDTVHVGQLHRAWLPATTSQLGEVAAESAPSISIQETAYGLRSVADRPLGNGVHYVRFTEYVAPFWSFIAHGEKEDRVTMGIVPIDDHNTMQWFVWYDHNAPLHDGTELAKQFAPLLATPDDFASTLRGKPLWGQDRSAFTGGHFTGIWNIVLEDVAVQESQGTIMDRTQERLGSSDQGITRARHLLIRTARAHQANGTIFPDPNLRSFAEIRALAVDTSDVTALNERFA